MKDESQAKSVHETTRMDEYAGNVILHLSDLHFGYDENQQATSERKNALKQLIQVVSSLDDPSWKPNVICITGDVAMRAIASEYLTAKTWIEKLLKSLGLGPDSLVICPGNHDACRNVAEGYAPPFNSDIADRLLSIDHFEKHLLPFEAYNKFCESLKVPPYSIAGKVSYITGFRQIGNIRFISLNSAWFSQRNKVNGKYKDEKNLWLGLNLLSCLETEGKFPQISSDKERYITIVLFHHPFEKLHDDEIHERPLRKNTKEFIALRSHIILTGHDHGIPSRPDQASGCAHYFKSGATYVNPIYDNSFHLIKLDETTGEDRVFKFRPSSSGTKWEMSPDSFTFPYWDAIAEIMTKERQSKEDSLKAQLESGYSDFEKTMLENDYKKGESNLDTVYTLLSEAKQILNEGEIEKIILKYGKMVQNHLPIMSPDTRKRFTEKMKRIIGL